jgi:hypothetical protein
VPGTSDKDLAFFSHVERALEAQHFAGINVLPLNLAVNAIA